MNFLNAIICTLLVSLLGVQCQNPTTSKRRGKVLKCHDPKYAKKAARIIRGYANSGAVPIAIINEILKLKDGGVSAFIEGVPSLLASVGTPPLPTCIHEISDNEESNVRITRNLKVS